MFGNVDSMTYTKESSGKGHITVEITAYNVDEKDFQSAAGGWERAARFLVKLLDGRTLPKTNETKRIERVIFNEPATIVLWSDNTKTVVKSHEEVFDKEKGLAMAITKKGYGNTSRYYRELKRLIAKAEELASSGKEAEGNE